MSSTISYYELLEADGVGISNIVVGLARGENVAVAWKAGNPTYRSYKRTTIVIFDSIEEFERDGKEKRVKNLLRTFNNEELALLQEHFTK